MNYEVKIESVPAKEFLVIKGFGKIYDPDAIIPKEETTWENIRNQFADGSVNRLKKAAGSETVYMLFCYTCTRSDEEKCWVCSYDIACENRSGNISSDYEVVRLNACEYAVYDCRFDSEVALPDAHDPLDQLFWGKWLKSNPNICAIDYPDRYSGKGYAQIELYTPFDIDAKKFKAKIWYPLLPKKE
ncbi:MAG TPA: hypothetical protein PLT91_05460 [Clostridia bacterium]|jgi:hypothetical protein|nr:MAG: hypothetical protein BWX97_00570 [Firmicutes bacterium ADurb.Bin146]HOD93432.1 hypothetical protein [Clostridia bacterium]HQM39668.1 hypothetical protein [Clostridia bacterium]